MEQPKYTPKGEPCIITKDNPLEYKSIPGISFHKDNDGIIYYYDRPLMFIAFIEGRQVIVTLLDDDMNYPDEPRRGWEQYIGIVIDDILLHDIYESRKPVRDYWRNKVPNWFIYRGDQVWEHEYKIWKNVPLLESWKAKDNVYLNHEVKGKPESWIKIKLKSLSGLLKRFTTRTQ
jgi:hypothetical protein